GAERLPVLVCEQRFSRVRGVGEKAGLVADTGADLPTLRMLEPQRQASGLARNLRHTVAVTEALREGGICVVVRQHAEQVQRGVGIRIGIHTQSQVDSHGSRVDSVDENIRAGGGIDERQLDQRIAQAVVERGNLEGYAFAQAPASAELRVQADLRNQREIAAAC